MIAITIGKGCHTLQTLLRGDDFSIACDCIISIPSNWSSNKNGATKLNPLNNWWALALGGTPGESGGKKF